MIETAGPMVVDGAVLAIGLGLGQEVGPRAYLAALYPDAEMADERELAEDAPPMVAQVNHGVWIAACECGAEGLPTPGTIVFVDRPIGWCLRCNNLAVGGRWRPVALPDEATRAAIEAVLACRADVGDRNWAPPETVADLVAQNVEHGESVPGTPSRSAAGDRDLDGCPGEVV